MRLLIYLLALFGGFSATEASCRAAEKPGTAVALASIALAQAASDPVTQTSGILSNSAPRTSAKLREHFTMFIAPRLVPLSPVLRMDLKRE